MDSSTHIGRGWTSSAAQLLVEAGADVGKMDSFGWTAKEHAALRGHLNIAKLLAEHEVSSLSANGAEDTQTPPSVSSSPPETLSLEDRRSDGEHPDHGAN